MAGYFFGVNLMWASSKSVGEFEGMQAVLLLASKIAPTRLFDASVLQKERKMDGWVLQQLLKLTIAREINADYYLIIDSKNTFFRRIHTYELFSPCHQARLPGQSKVAGMPEPHHSWYLNSAKFLNLSRNVSDWDMPLSITPALFRKKTVIELLSHINDIRAEDVVDMFKQRQSSNHTQASRARATSSLLAQTNAPFEIRPFQLSSADEKLLYALSSYGENRITEFTLYNLFVLTKLAPAESRCAHAATRTMPWGYEIWRGQPEAVERIRQYAAHFSPGGEPDRAPLVFGMQSGTCSVGALSAEDQYAAASLVQGLMDNAGLLRGGEDPKQVREKALEPNDLRHVPPYPRYRGHARAVAAACVPRRLQKWRVRRRGRSSPRIRPHKREPTKIGISKTLRQFLQPLTTKPS